MENIVGTPLIPMITIINNTDEELENVLLSYNYQTVTYVHFDKISAFSTYKAPLNLKEVATPISLELHYSHNSIKENHLIIKSLKKSSNIFSITIEITTENNYHSVNTIIERDIVDNCIELSHKKNKKSLKIFLILSTILACSCLTYFYFNKKHSLNK